MLSALVLFCCSTVPATAGLASHPSAAAADELFRRSAESSVASSHGSSKSTKPDAPTPKSDSAPGANGESTSLEPAVSAAPLNSAVKPATSQSYETSRKRKLWYGLMAVNHGAAAFDAWSTRRAISGGYGTEGDPLQRPFANSGAIYATTQIVPTLMDFLGRRLMHSESPTVRKFWWIPQAASAGVSLGAGIHNYRLVH